MHQDSNTDEKHKQHYERFSQQDEKIASVKTDVGVIQSNVESLSRGQVAMQESMTAGFKSVNDSITAKGSEPLKIGAGLLATVVTVILAIGATGISALWLTITLLVEPIVEDERDIEGSVLILNEQRIEDAFNHGKSEAEYKWLRADIEATKAYQLRHRSLLENPQHTTQ